MRRFAVLFGLLMAASIGYAQPVMGVEQSYDARIDSLKTAGDTVRASTKNVAKTRDLHGWFDQELLTLGRKYHSMGMGYRLTPLGVYKTRRVFDRQDTAKWNIGVEYHFPLNTMNGAFTVYSYDFGKVEAYAKLFFGFGMRPISGIEDSLDIEATANYGITGELFFDREKQWLNPLLGLTYLWVSPNKGPDGQGAYMYAGNRLYLVGDLLSLDLKGGPAFWRGGFKENSPTEWFASAGLTLHSLVNVTPAGKPLLAPLEVGLTGNVSLKAVGGKLLLPFRLRKGVTLAPVLEYGRELDSEPYDNVIGIGAELRLFGDVSISPLNPYIGFQQTWLTGGPSTGSGTSVYFGSRYYLHDQVALDANFGPAFWQSDIQDEYGLKEWMGRIGIVFAFGKIREKYTARGAIVTKSGNWGTNPIDTRNYERLTDDELYDYDGEVRVYGLEEGVISDSCLPPAYCHDSCKPCPPCDSCCPESNKVYPQLFGDLRDLKFYKIDMEFGLELDPFNLKAGLLNEGEAKHDEVFIAVLFNKVNTKVANLNSSNTLFHFVDLDSSQYFGYRWERDLTRQPEHRDLGPLGGSIAPAGQPYMGQYIEFVQPMTWLDDSLLMGFIDGKAVERKLLEVISEETVKKGLEPLDLSKYRIGYVTYRQNTLAKLTQYRKTSDLGVTIMVGNDQDRAALTGLTDDCGFALSSGSDITESGEEKLPTFETGGDYYFSNHVKMDDVFGGYVFEPDDVTIANFPFCQVTLSSGQKLVLDNKVIRRLKNSPAELVCLAGFVDATPMMKSCEYNGDPIALAQDRAQSVADYLIAMGVPASQIMDTKGIGLRPPGRMRQGQDRCVIVKFMK